jgi:hypothetical protein
MNAAPSRPRIDRLALLAVGALLIPLFLPRVRPPEGRWWETGWDALHFPGFILITWAVARLTEDRIAVGAVVGLIIAGLSEWAHDILGRSSSWSDFRVDAIGVACGVIGWFWLRKGGKKGLLAFSALTLAILVWLLSPAWGGWLARNHLRGQFPDLGCFSESGSRYVWRAQNHASARPDPESGGLLVRIEPGLFGGVNCWPAQPDWSQHRELRLSIDNPGPDFTLGLRLDDPLSSSTVHDSRYNGEFRLVTGANDLRLPLDKVAAGTRNRPPLDLSQIQRLILFTIREDAPREFTIRAARLE